MTERGPGDARASMSRDGVRRDAVEERGML